MSRMEIKNDLKKNSDFEHCPVRNVISCFSSKWAILILFVLAERSPLRFNAVGRSISDISPKVLTSTLKSLESSGLVSREIYPEVPPRVEYSLTPLGRSLVSVLTPLVRWATEHFSEVTGSGRTAE